MTSLMSSAGSAAPRQRLAIACRFAAIGEGAEPQLAGLIEDRVTILEFDNRAAGLEGEDVAVGRRRHLEQAGAHRPILAVEFDHGAAGKPGQVGREIVGADDHIAQFMKSSARILRIGVAVEEIADGESADGYRDAVDVALARQLIGRVGHFFLFAAETKGLPEEIALCAKLGYSAPPFCASPFEKPARPSVPLRPKPCASSGSK